MKGYNKFCICLLILFVTVLFIYMYLCISIYMKEQSWKTLSRELYNSVVNENYKPYKLYGGLKGYRLGDMILYSHWRNTDEGEKFHLKYYPNSITSKYMKITKDEKNINVLNKIIKNEKGEKAPKNTLIIHLRTGDAIDTRNKSVIDLLYKKTHYVKSLKYFKKILEKINKYGIKNIVLVSGSHVELNFIRSSQYINCIKKYLEQNGMKVKLRLGNNPDSDLIYMSSSDYYTPAGGGYSYVIQKLVENNGKIVITSDVI
jgi:hypothetical protein